MALGGHAFLDWLLTVVLVVAGLSVAFVVWSYGLALMLTRGRFGWPGLGYLLRETIWVVLTQTLLPFGWVFSHRPATSVLAPGKRPVIFIHGYIQNRTNFVWLSRWLGQRGLGPFFAFDYFSLAPVAESARKLQAFVEKIVERTGATHVDLVCHSLGGLVARAYVDLLGGHARVRHIVTLGTPHRGLSHAKLGFGHSVRDMHPPTGFIRRLEDAPLPESVRYHSIYSVHDNIVFPRTASDLGARGRNVVVSGHGHFGILFSVEVAEHVFSALTLHDVAVPVEAGAGSLVAETAANLEEEAHAP